MDINKQAELLEAQKNIGNIDPDLEKKVQENLNNIPDEDKDVEQEDEVVEEEVEETVESEVVDKKDEVVLPENFQRAAIHQGWTEDEISEFFTKSPEQALKTFSKIYESTNYITEQTAALGRINQEETKKRLDAEIKKNERKPRFSDAIEEIKKKHGEDDPGLIAVMEAITNQNEILFNGIENLKKIGKPEQSDESTRLATTITGFFKTSSGFEDFYGKVQDGQPWNRILTGEQVDNRMKVVELADQIMAGSQLQGKPIDYDVALERAHLSVTAKFAEKIVYDKIVDKLKERSKGLTVRSTGKKTDETTLPKGDKRAEKNVGARLKKLFGGSVD